jgi:hypothetical protein
MLRADENLRAAETVDFEPHKIARLHRQLRGQRARDDLVARQQPLAAALTVA